MEVLNNVNGLSTPGLVSPTNTFVPNPYTNDSGSTFGKVVDTPWRNISFEERAQIGLNEGNRLSSDPETAVNAPALHEAEKVKVDWSKLDWNDPDSVVKFAINLQNINPELAEMLLNYGLSEKSNLAQYNRSLEASNTSYQRMVKDLQAAGLNPFLAFQGLSGSQVSSGSSSYGLGSITSMANNSATNKRGLQVAGIAALALILSSMFKMVISKR